MPINLLSKSVYMRNLHVLYPTHGITRVARSSISPTVQKMYLSDCSSEKHQSVEKFIHQSCNADLHEVIVAIIGQKCQLSNTPVGFISHACDLEITRHSH